MERTEALELARKTVSGMAGASTPFAARMEAVLAIANFLMEEDEEAAEIEVNFEPTPPPDGGFLRAMRDVGL